MKLSKPGLSPVKSMIGLGLLAGFLLGVAVGAVDAADRGYWSCESGSWRAVEEPDYPKPLKRCGSVVHIPETQAACDLRGGSWQVLGLAQYPSCLMPTRDAGRICGDTGECEGMCLSDYDLDDAMLAQGRERPSRGTCSKTVQVYGCIAPVEKGRVFGILCVD